MIMFEHNRTKPFLIRYALYCISWKVLEILKIFIIDETLVQIGDTDDAWLWVAIIEPIHHRILGVYISRHRGIC